MLTKPLSECDETDLKTAVAESSATIAQFQATLSSYQAAVRLRQRALCELRDRFGATLNGRRQKQRELWEIWRAPK